MVPLPGFFLIDFGCVCRAATVPVVLKPIAEAALVVCAFFLLVDISHLNVKQVNMALSTKDSKFHKINENVSKTMLQTG